MILIRSELSTKSKLKQRSAFAFHRGVRNRAHPAVYTGEIPLAAFVEEKQRHGARRRSAEVLGVDGTLRAESRIADCRSVARGIVATVRAVCLVSRENMVVWKIVCCSDEQTTWNS